MIVFADSLREVIVHLVEFESLEEKTVVILGDDDEDEVFLQEEFKKNTIILHPDGFELIRGIRAKNVIFIKASNVDQQIVNCIVSGLAATNNIPLKRLS